MVERGRAVIGMERVRGLGVCRVGQGLLWSGDSLKRERAALPVQQGNVREMRPRFPDLACGMHSRPEDSENAGVLRRMIVLRQR